MKKKIIITLCAIFGCLALAAIGAYGWHRSLIASFPMWREVEEPPCSENPLGSLEALGVETVVWEDMAWDELQVSLAMSEDSPYPISLNENAPVFIDYKYQGIWYNIWEGEGLYAYVQYEPKEAPIRLPVGLFRVVGEYRVRLTETRWDSDKPLELGRASFLVSSPTRTVEGKKDNNFPVWIPQGGPTERFDELSREDLLISFKDITQRTDEYPLINVGIKARNGKKTSYEGNLDEYVFYLYEGYWYQVSPFWAHRLYSMPHPLEPGEEAIEKIQAFPEILEHSGTYRLMLRDLGYCDFQVEDGVARAE